MMRIASCPLAVLRCNRIRTNDAGDQRHESIRVGRLGASSISGSTALAADIHVMSGGAPKEVLAVLTPEFEKQTGHKVHFTYIVISAMQQKLAAGEKPDMVLMPAPALEAQVKAGVMRDAPRPNLGIVSVGLVVREGAREAGHFDARQLQESDARREVDRARQSGRDAERRASRESVGAARHRGRHEAEARRIRNALDGGVAAIARGEAEIGLYPLSEIISEKGVTRRRTDPARRSSSTRSTRPACSQRTPRPSPRWRSSNFSPIRRMRSTGSTAGSSRRSNQGTIGNRRRRSRFRSTTIMLCATSDSTTSAERHPSAGRPQRQSSCRREIG